jgi:hypothetical protein
VRVFIDPLRTALSVLDGHARVTIARHGTYRMGVEYAWALNAGDGMALGSVGTFYASMRFQIVPSNPAHHDEDHQGEYRCTTRGYNYKLTEPDGTDLWRIHWHPVGHSPAKGPHQHLPPDLKRHLPGGRTTFEDAIMWVMEYGGPLRCDRGEALNTLAVSDATHRLYRTWHSTPPDLAPLPPAD